MKLLLTAFEPFDATGANASLRVLQTIRKRRIQLVTLSTAVLPVDARKAPPQLIRNIDKSKPDTVICLGQASRRAAISIERVALNLLDFEKPDNAGRKLIDRPIAPDGPAAYFATLPVRRLQRVLTRAGIPAELSRDAGGYLCNQVFYTLLHHLAQRRPETIAGFIHLPMLPEQSARSAARSASMSIETSVLAVKTIIAALSKIAPHRISRALSTER
jgi:pyroglutamyl-peptidase